MIWTQGVVELLRWRRQRRVLAAQGATLVVECQRYLAELGDDRPPPEPPRREPPRLG